MSTYTNCVIADLRSIRTVEAANAIEEIKNVAILALPEDGDPAVLEAIARIPKKNVATTISLPQSTPITQLNGSAKLNASLLSQDAVLITNGSAVVTEPAENCQARLIVNGSFLYPKSCDLNIIAANGSSKAIDYEHYAAMEDDVTIDRDLLDLMEPKTLFCVEGDARFTKDLTLDLLKEKKPYFIVEGDVRCPKAISAYLKLYADIEGDLRVKGEAYDEDDDE